MISNDDKFKEVDSFCTNSSKYSKMCRFKNLEKVNIKRRKTITLNRKVPGFFAEADAQIRKSESKRKGESMCQTSVPLTPTEPLP